MPSLSPAGRDPHAARRAMVMVVNDKSQVEARNVVAAQAIGDKWLISEGLKPGDKVIVSGLQKRDRASR